VLAIARACHGVHQHGEGRPAPHATRLPQRQEARAPTSALLVGAARPHPAPEHGEPQGPRGPIMGGLLPGFHHERPQGLHLPLQRAGQLPSVVLSRPGLVQPLDHPRRPGLHVARTRRPHQASAGAVRSERPRARRSRGATPVCRACPHGQYTPEPALTRIPAQRAIRASNAAVCRWACTVTKATVVFPITHHHVNTPCGYQLGASMEWTAARRAVAAIAASTATSASEPRSTAPWTPPRLRWPPKTAGQSSCTARRPLPAALERA
jgi:hypothetical protein